MVQLTDITNILKSAKMTLHMEPHFVLELRIDSELSNDNRIELLQRPGSKAYYFNPDCCKVRINYIAEDEVSEFYPYMNLVDKQYDNMYDLISDCLFRIFKDYGESMDLFLENIEVKSNPCTAGFFYKYTFDKIMHGYWARKHVDFECVRYTDGDLEKRGKASESKLANDRQMNKEALNRMEKLAICEKQKSIFRDSFQIPLTIVEGNKLKQGLLSDEEFQIAMKLSEDNNYIIYYAIRNKGHYMDGAEFEKITFLVVTPYKEDWINVHRDIDKGFIEAYVYNKEIPDYSELSGVKIENIDGILVDIEE